jgi:murein L,D-transpeptidase YcbB/YkuD
VDALIKTIHEADFRGLKPSDYHLSKIEVILKEARKNQNEGKALVPGILIDLDLLLTDAFLIYSSHLLAGCINPETIYPEWSGGSCREADLTKLLQTALDSNQIEETLKNLLPTQPEYIRLRQALARYRDIAAKGGWRIVPDGLKMQKGHRGVRVVKLRERLIAEESPDQELHNSSDLFDDDLEQTVREFQKRYGLKVDGIVGPQTLAALNVPVNERVRQIELNMERWRWLPQNFSQRYILVNIANFELDVFENGKTVMTMRVVVGKRYRRTPVFSGKMTYLVLSPYWYIPRSIAVQDILPMVHKDPDYLIKQNIKVFQGWGAETKEFSSKTIDWTKITDENFNYRFRQEPGPNNSLGRVKFIFPNKFNVYLHDTPHRELFAKSVRTFSSGCIRVEKPIELAEYLLRDSHEWTREDILAAIDKGIEKTVWLPEPIEVHLLYWTAWANEDGSIQFRNDIYGRDKLLDDALRKEPPTS